MIDKYNFFRSTLFFSISTFGSRAITLLLLPLYSYSLSLSDYGEVDLALTAIMLIVPIVTLNIHESLLKFLMEGNDDDYLYSALVFLVVVLLPLTTIFIFVNYLVVKLEIIYYLGASIGMVAVYEALSKSVKAKGLQPDFAKSNILIAIVSLCLNFALVYYLKLGSIGVILSHSISFLCGSIFLLGKINIRKLVSASGFRFEHLKKMLIVSIPLVPNAIMWWVFNASDRFIILNYLGTEDNGLYGVANRISSILLIVSTIVYQAWQLKAFSIKNNAARKEVYTIYIQNYMLFIFFLAAVFVSFNQHFMGWILSDEYSQSWRTSNILIMSTSFYSLASAIGVFYVIDSNTRKAFYSSSISAIVNLLLNFFLIPIYGIDGAAIATLLSTLCIFIHRIFDNKTFFSVSLKFLISILSYLILAFYLSLYESFYISLTLLLVMFFYILRSNSGFLKSRIDIYVKK